jgi:hypothetical protein
VAMIFRGIGNFGITRRCAMIPFVISCIKIQDSLEQRTGILTASRFCCTVCWCPSATSLEGQE